MAEIFVKHTLNPYKVAKFNLNLSEYTVKGEAGDKKWLLEIGTMATTTSGLPIAPIYIHNVEEKNLELEVDKVVAKLCSKIDWSDFVEDRYAPHIVDFSPQGDNTYIKSTINFTIKDDDPSSGIDISDMSVIFNNGEMDFDITSEITHTGDPYTYNFTWLPPNING